MAKTRQIGFRLPEDEYERIMVIFGHAQERTMGYAPLGDVIRELLGLIPLKLVNEEDRAFLAGSMSKGQQAGLDRTQLQGSGFLDAARPGKRLGRGKPNN